MKSRATRTEGTAKELADNGVGYVASGEGEWSRNRAKADNVRLRGYMPPPRNRTRAPKQYATDIRCNEIELSRLERALTVERNPARVAKLRKNIAIKSAFVERLKDEERQGIETIHGADEYESWDKI
jgi:hypothetical protein